MRVISHRGARGHADENSLKAIKIASELSIDYIEFDIQLTKNNIVVLQHDLKTPKGLAIKDYAYKSLQREISYMPTLRDALKECGDKPAIIESKVKGAVAKSLTIINGSPNACIASKLPEEILSARINLPSHKTWLIKGLTPFGVIKMAKEIDASGIGLNKNWLPLLLYYYFIAKRSGLEVYTYTVNNYYLAKLLSYLMKDLYIVTDYPKKMLDKNEQ